MAWNLGDAFLLDMQDLDFSTTAVVFLRTDLGRLRTYEEARRPSHPFNSTEFSTLRNLYF